MTALSHRLLAIPRRSFELLRELCDTQTRARISIAARNYNTSRLAVLVRIIRLYLAARFHPLESLANGMADPNRPLNDHHEHFSSEELHGLQTAVNTPLSAMCRDKLLFHYYCHNYGLPVPRLLAILSRHGSRTDAGQSLDRPEDLRSFALDSLPPSFIAKPRGGNMGRGVRLIQSGGEDRTEEDERALVVAIEELGREPEDQLLEERLKIHPSIRTLTGTDGVSSVRVITFVPYQEPPRILSAALRIIVGDSITDNFSDFRGNGYSGNILAVVDPQTGEAEWAYMPSPDGVGRNFVDTHPRTGISLNGFTLPLWPEVQALVIKAAACFLPLRIIGWDVAITPEGPALIEANELFQYSSSGPKVPTIRSALRQESGRLAGIASVGYAKL